MAALAAFVDAVGIRKPFNLIVQVPELGDYVAQTEFHNK